MMNDDDDGGGDTTHSQQPFNTQSIIIRRRPWQPETKNEEKPQRKVKQHFSRQVQVHAP